MVLGNGEFHHFKIKTNKNIFSQSFQCFLELNLLTSLTYNV